MARKVKDDVWYVADFETTGINFYNDNHYTKVWLWAVADNNADIVANGTDIDSFIDWLLNASKIVYFHNLKFDGSFIIPYLESKGFTFKKELECNDNRNYSALVNDMGIWYNIKIKYACRQGKKIVRNTIEIRDSLKLCPMKVEAMTKAFGLDVGKETLDYENYEVTAEAISYVNHDVMVVAKALKFFYDMKFTKLTIGSCAFNDLKQYINDGYNIPRHKTGKYAVNYFGKLFPSLDRDWLRTWRQAYTGGRSQVNPKYANKIMHEVKRFDINSMYPSRMCQCDMPYGEPIRITKMGTYKFELYHLIMSFHLKEGHLPTLLASKRHTIFGGDQKYYVNEEFPIDIYISNIDFEVFKRHYEIDYMEFEEMYGFRTSKTLFTDWVMKYYNLKSEMGRIGNKGLKTIYKLIINNIYGKFGSNAEGKSKTPYMDEEGIMRFELGEMEEMGIYYLPVAIAITSYGHMMIDNEISDETNDWKVRYGFIYCDTDSIHTIGDIHAEMIDNEELGMFKLEAVEDTAKYIRAKTYCHKDGTKWEITCAGMTDGIKKWLVDEFGDEIVDVFSQGLEVTPEMMPKKYKPKLMHKQVEGGTILVPTQFTLQRSTLSI